MRIPLRRLLTLLTAVLAPATTAALTLGGPAYADPSGPSDGVWPLAPRPEVVARFDPPATRWGAGHRGADLLGRAGQPVRTALAGRVSFAGMLAGRGVVVVDHGRTRTTYEPVTASVSVGHRLAAGAVLGRLQVFGSHCFPGSCLHWGLVEGRDHYLDPLTLVGAGPVRLLAELGEVGGASFTVPTVQRPSCGGLELPVVMNSSGPGCQEGPAPAGPSVLGSARDPVRSW